MFPIRSLSGPRRNSGPGMLPTLSPIMAQQGFSWLLVKEQKGRLTGRSLPPSALTFTGGCPASTTSTGLIASLRNVAGTLAPRSLAGKPLAGFRATPDRRIPVLARIHRWTALGTALEAAGGCSSESGIMVLEQKPARKEGAPNRGYHAIIPTASASPLTITAWWPMLACSCRPPSPGTWACGNSSTITSTSAARQGGPTGGTRC